MKEILLPRGYQVNGFSCLSYAEACAHAANTSDYQHNTYCAVVRDPLVKNGEEIEGSATVATWRNGKQVFPKPIS